MNLKAIDAAMTAYRTNLDDTDNARLTFFRKLWAVQQDAANEAGQSYEVPSKNELKRWARAEEPVLIHAPVTLDATVLTKTLEHLVDVLVEQGGFSESARGALVRTNWERMVAASNLDTAGSNPACYVEQFTKLLVDDGCSDEAASIGAVAAALALRALLEKPAQAIESARRAGNADVPHPVHCPVCGGDAAVAQVGSGVAAEQGRAKRLWCAQCGCVWAFERVRCARCGTQNQGHLHYFNLEGDEAHRLATCDKCNSYTRTVYEDDTLAPFSFEVEDVVMAKLDLVAYQRLSVDAAQAQE